MSKELFRSLPSIERLLATAAAARAITALGRDRARDMLREITDQLRREIASGEWPDEPSGSDNGQPTADVAAEIERRMEAQTRLADAPSLRRVVNATGVILHTNLGRAPLARAATERVLEIASNYSNLEYNLDRGGRGRRESHCLQLLARLAGSESAVVTNNNAAAVLLVLNTLAEGGEVIVSRGELIEIGGSFRIPDVMEKSGARLKEVGTTNRTRISDYERAITSDTRLILRVHPSNYRIIGFTERPSVAEIAGLARRANVPSFEDLGSGCLIDLTPYGVKDEPTVAESIKAGISVVSFSGDKMLGGPQSGVIAGSSRIIDRVRDNPLMRALRVDKMTYAALEATLRIYERGAAEEEIPVISRIASDLGDIASRAESFALSVRRATSGRVKATAEEGASVIGGGSAPEAKLPTVLVALEDEERTAAVLEEWLRHNSIPIIARTERDRVLIDLRTVREDEEAIIVEALRRLAQPAQGSAASM